MEQYQHNHNFANIGEKIAKYYLLRHGYTLKHSNFRIHNDEIDIIACKNKAFCFIEVKTRLSSRCDPAEYHLSFRKIHRLRRASQRYCEERHIPEQDIRLEGIAINLDVYNKMANIKHFLRLL